jgi:amino acid transporter
MVARERYERREKQEKQEKGEKQEKQEKGEKQETSVLWALVAGLILIALGVISVLTTFFGLAGLPSGAVFLLVIGVVIILVAIYSAVRAGRRSPRP